MQLKRQQDWDAVGDEVFDVAIIGAGINGACAFDRLCRSGRRVLLVDSGDFASGTSQSSGMLVWGGLLYLRQLDLKTVWKLSRARDAMIASPDLPVACRSFRYVMSGRPLARRAVHLGLWLYWFLGRGRRSTPVRERCFPEASWLASRSQDSLRYEEAALDVSDSRFVLDWIFAHSISQQVALNHCRASTGEYDPDRGEWRLQLTDQMSGRHSLAKARCVVNCAGIWTDDVNASFDIDSPYRHALSKGVFVAISRPATHRSTLVFDTGSNGDAICLIPWGPVSLWGPTETWVDRPQQGYQVDAEDLHFLYDQASRHLRRAIRPEEIVSLRSGVRPLLVRRGQQRPAYPLDQSRQVAVVRHGELPWISVYGGKITGCVQVAERVLATVEAVGVKASSALSSSAPAHGEHREAEFVAFPGLEKPVRSADWCMRHESCLTLEDYLRRRTDIAQWVPRCGLGRRGENRSALLAIAETFAGVHGRSAVDLLEEYESSVVARFDALMEIERKEGLHAID